jgi:hypothetical protein
MLLKLGHFRKQIRNNVEVLKFGTGENQEVCCYLESRRRGIS